MFKKIVYIGILCILFFVVGNASAILLISNEDHYKEIGEVEAGSEIKYEWSIDDKDAIVDFCLSAGNDTIEDVGTNSGEGTLKVTEDSIADMIWINYDDESYTLEYSYEVLKDGKIVKSDEENSGMCCGSVIAIISILAIAFILSFLKKQIL